MYNKMQSYFYCNVVKQSYQKVSEIYDVEDVYYKNNKLVVFVKNEETGQQLYDIMKSLTDRENIIEAEDISFQIDKYYADKKNVIKWFCINFNFQNSWKELSKLEKLLRLIAFIYSMKINGYILKESRFENEKCKSIANFLTFFELDGEKVDNYIECKVIEKLHDKEIWVSDGCLIKHIHYVLSNGEDFDEFYKEVIDNNVIYDIYNFPYYMPIIKMCYEYYLSGSITNIYNVLQMEIEKQKWYKYYEKYLLTDINKLKYNSSIIEENDEFTIYDGNIKIYHNMTSEFEKFLRDNEKSFRNSRILLEKIDKLIIDFDEKIIGYTFKIGKGGNTKKLLEERFYNQKSIFDFINSINTLLFDTIQIFNDGFYRVNNNFNLEEAIIDLKVKNVKEIFNLATNDEELLNQKITIIFFKLLFTYLNEKYGKMYNEKQFLEKTEVRYLSPILAREFINFSLVKTVDYNQATEELAKFLCYNFLDEQLECRYDYRFTDITSEINYYGEILSFSSIFDRNIIDKKAKLTNLTVRMMHYRITAPSFLFNYEVEEKYGITVKKEKEKILDDNRKIVFFTRKKDAQKFYAKASSKKEKIKSTMTKVDEKIKLVGISELIYSTEINEDNTYKLIGYISEPIKGKLLTTDVLLSLDNKQMLKVFAHLFTKFGKRYIPWECIRMDDDFTFYIDIFNEDVKVRNTNMFVDDSSNFIKSMVKYLCSKGYNKNAFADIDFSKYYLENYLIEMSNSFDNYCNEHKIFYNSKYNKLCSESNKLCPVCHKTKYLVPSNFKELSDKIFEDSIATHYRISEKYNLKVYKANIVDIESIQKNIEHIIELQSNYEEIRLGQDCFIPYKKAVTNNSEFIGYIYEAVEFSEETNNFIDIKNSHKLKNLPKIMSLIRLLLQIKEITKNGMSFISNPYGHVFLSKAHKKQVQILNIELLSDKGNVEDTIKWTCEYVCNVINANASIRVSIYKKCTDIDFILKELQDLSKDMTKYCSIHEIYYKSKHLFCPMCIDKRQMKDIEVEEINTSKIIKKKADDKGGEAFIYYEGKDTVIKIFNNEIDYNFKYMIIAKLLSKRKILESINKKNLKFKYIIPEKIYTDSKTHNISGYSMKRVNGFPISILKDKEEVKEHNLNMKDVFEILITVGEGIETLHKEANIFIGDLNGQNIFFDSDKNVYFLDFDGMGIDDIALKTCTDEYIDPISDKNNNITMKDDWYSFAVQAFHYLTFVHPFNGLYYDTINGRKVSFNIVDKMEHRISLLGNHGIKVPSIAVPWDWMSKELEKKFLDIFERENRESLVPYLKKQYKELYGGDNCSIVRINPIFIAKKVKVFSDQVVKVINQNAALCCKHERNNSYEYIAILVNNDANENIQYNINIPYIRSIEDVQLSKNKEIAWLISKYSVTAIALKSNTEIYTEEISDIKNVVINEDILYFTGVSENENVIFKREFAKKEKIRFLTKQQTKRFLVKLNDKFVVVKSGEYNTDEIYCNSDKLCEIRCSSRNAQYNIMYDDITKSWLVINDEGNGIFIDMSNGEHGQFNLPENIKLENVYFRKKNIYIPSENCLYIFNLTSKSYKKMECNRIMTPDTKLYNIKSEGFSVINDNILYDIRRG